MPRFTPLYEGGDDRRMNREAPRTPRFEDVQTAYAERDLEIALEHALALWRVSRAGAIADAIEAMSKEMGRSFEPPEVRTNAAFHDQWLSAARAAKPAAGAWLAENVFSKLPGNDMDDKQDAFLARLKAIRKAPPDPRMARALMTLIEQAPPIVSWSGAECRRALEHVGDERTLGALEKLAKQSDKPALLRSTMAKLNVEKLADEEVAGWSKIGARLGQRASSDRDALFQAVLDAPLDVHAREVLADCLQEQGDPRGELIAIQLAEERGDATPEATKRADLLIKQHKKAWLGALARVTYRAQFRGGFLDELMLDGSWKAGKAQWTALAKDPLLATVRYIYGKARDDIRAQFVGSPALRALERVDVDADVIADALERRPPLPTLRAIDATSWSRTAVEKKLVSRVLPLIEATPTIDSLAFPDKCLDAVMRSAAWPRLRALAVRVGDARGMTIWKQLPTHITSLRFGWDRITLRRLDGEGLGLHLELEEGLDWSATLSALRKASLFDRLEYVELSGVTKSHRATILAVQSRNKQLPFREIPHRSGLASGFGS